MLKQIWEYLIMKWLMSGWKYLLGLGVSTLLAYIAYPYILLWLYEKGYTISWVGVMLVVILAVTLVSFIAMFINAVFVDPKVGKTKFKHK